MDGFSLGRKDVSWKTVVVAPKVHVAVPSYQDCNCFEKKIGSIWIYLEKVIALIIRELIGNELQNMMFLTRERFVTTCKKLRILENQNFHLFSPNADP